MSTVSHLLTKLGDLGVTLRADGTRLLVQAPGGVITPELRTEMARRKVKILAAIQGTSRAANEDAPATLALHELSGLLAKAYQRHFAVQQVTGNQPRQEPDLGLALSSAASVHESGT